MEGVGGGRPAPYSLKNNLCVADGSGSKYAPINLRQKNSGIGYKRAPI